MNETIPIPTRFADRAAMLAHVAALSGLEDAASAVPDIAAGGRKAAEAALAKGDVAAFARLQGARGVVVADVAPRVETRSADELLAASERRRRHESAHLVAGYRLGLPVAEYSAGDRPRVEFYYKTGTYTRDDAEALACVAL